MEGDLAPLGWGGLLCLIIVLRVKKGKLVNSKKMCNVRNLIMKLLLVMSQSYTHIKE